MRRGYLSVIVCVIILGLLPANVRAEENMKEERSEGFVAGLLAPIYEGEFASLLRSPVEMILSPLLDLGDIVTTPARTQEYVFNINKSVTVITEKDIEAGEYNTVQEALSSRGGMVVSGYFANAKDSHVDLGGFGETGFMNYVFMIDGRRINQIDLSGPDLGQIDIRNIERIEIIRGAASVLYGDNASSGVINVITKKGEKGHKVEYVQEFGGYRYSKEYASIEGGEGFLDYFLSYSYQDSDGYRQNNRYEANDIFGSITMKPEEFLDINFTSGYHRDWYGMPGALYTANIDRDGRTYTRFPDSKAKTEDYYITAEPRIFGENGENEWMLSSLFSYRSRRTDTISVGSNSYENDHNISFFEISPKIEIGSSFFGECMQNKLIVGSDYYSAKDRILSGDITIRGQKYAIKKETFGVYFSDNMLIDNRFIINTGARGERAEYVFDQSSPVQTSSGRSLRETAVDAGIGYKYNETSQVFANYARSYRFPATDEYFTSAYEYWNWLGLIQLVPATLNTSLKQQVGNNYEVGIKDRTLDNVGINASYFIIDNKNEIYYDTNIYANTNYHHTFHQGLNIEVDTGLSDILDAFFSYTYNKSRFVGGIYDGKDIPLVPRHKITGGITYEMVDNLKIGAELNFLSSRFMASDQMNNAAKLKEYFVADITLSYVFGNWRIFARVKNLFSEKYFINATKDWRGDGAYYPAPERAFEGGVSVTF